MKRPTSVFVVVQAAVYRHDVGPFAFTLDEAVELAKKRQLLEKDNHHEFEVLEIKEGSLEDGNVVATVRGNYKRVEKTSQFSSGGEYKYNVYERIEGFEVTLR
jgi:hypothetical protein